MEIIQGTGTLHQVYFSALKHPFFIMYKVISFRLWHPIKILNRLTVLRKMLPFLTSLRVSTCMTPKELVIQRVYSCRQLLVLIMMMIHKVL